MPSKVQLIGGVFQDAEGNALVDGYLTLQLSQDGSVTGVGQIASGITVRINLNALGSVDTSTPQDVWGNDQIIPVNSFYIVRGFAADGQPAWGPNNQQVIGNGGTFDVGTWVPNQLISWVPPLQPLELETNGTPNAIQTLLNLIAGSNVTLTADGAGGVTVAASVPAGITTEVNSTPLASQTVLNFEDTTTVTWANPSGGIVKATAISTPVLGPGSISISATRVNSGTGSVAVNLSTEGTRDFFALSTGGSLTDPQTSQNMNTIHGKVLGGWIRRNFRAFGPLGTIANVGSAATQWLWTTNSGDDDVSGQTNGNNVLSSVNFAAGFFSNISSVISGGFGFEFSDIGTLNSRTLNLYIGVNSGGTRTDSTFTITARLADGSAADVQYVIAPGVTGLQWYKVVITYTAGSGGSPLMVSAVAQQVAADSGTEIFFAAVTAA